MGQIVSYRMQPTGSLPALRIPVVCAAWDMADLAAAPPVTAGRVPPLLALVTVGKPGDIQRSS
jgi:hypothetical protein